MNCLYASIDRRVVKPTEAYFAAVATRRWLERVACPRIVVRLVAAMSLFLVYKRELDVPLCLLRTMPTSATGFSIGPAYPM